MPRVPLLGGSSESRSGLASNQRSINIFSEANPPENDPTVQVTQFLTPGTTSIWTAPNGGAIRQIYWATNSEVYLVAGNTLYYQPVGPIPFAPIGIGTIAAGTTPVSMKDNATTLVLVDGTVNGYTVNLATHAFAGIADGAFYGADTVDYIDTYFVFNKKGTQQFYISNSNATTFNPLYFAGKVGSQDLLLNIMCVRREIWLFGQKTTEIWIDSGDPAFPFAIMSGAYMEHGIAAIYSLAKIDTTPFWLSQDKQGDGIVLQGHGYQGKRISTHALEYEWSNYTNISDAEGFCYQLAGHSFYVLTFPTADKTWAYDIATEQWHQWAWMDGAGALHRTRSRCAASFGFVPEVFTGDWQNGKIYRLDLTIGTDDGQPIQRIRSFPNLVKDGKRVFHRKFILDAECGNALPGSPAPVVGLRYSDDHGNTYGNTVYGDFGLPGQYNRSIQFRRLGYSRDRTYEVSWTSPAVTSLNGAFVDTDESAS